MKTMNTVMYASFDKGNKNKAKDLYNQKDWINKLNEKNRSIKDNSSKIETQKQNKNFFEVLNSISLTGKKKVKKNGVKTMVSTSLYFNNKAQK